METSHLQTNPYASPTCPGDAGPTDGRLVSACRYFKAIGWVALLYTACMIAMALYEILTDESPQLGEVIGVPIMITIMLVFFGTMIRTAMLLPGDFERLYKRARWLGILAGAFGFPILTIPAFIGVSRLSKYRTITNHSSDAKHGNE